MLRLTASDTLLTAFSDVTITVNPAPPTNQAPVVNAGTGADDHAAGAAHR